MPLEFAPQCCDAPSYVGLGEACSKHLAACWHGLRPTGAVFYFSLPFRLGLPAEFIIVLNALLTVLVASVAVVALMELSTRWTRVSRVLLAVGTVFAHACFMAGTIRNSLSDVPAAAFAMLSLWLLTLAGARQRLSLYAGAGAALGIATVLRAFFLYPALLAAGCVILLMYLRKEPRVRVAAFVVPFVVPVLIQFGATYAHVRAWAFIDPASTAAGARLHFENDVYGYDTLAKGWGVPYSAPQCFHDAVTMGEALRKHEWGEALCLVAHRQWFYFGSYVWGGKTYLEVPEERHFSVAFLLMNGLVVLTACLWILQQARRLHLLLVPVLFLGVTWAEGSAIIPEARFLIAFHVFSWTLAVAGVLDFSLRLAAKGAHPSDEDGFGWIPVAFSKRVVIPIASAWRSFDARSLLRKELVAPASAVAATLIVHGMALGSDFVDEDLRHLYESQEFDTFKFLVMPYGNHFCAFFRFWVALLHSFFGVHALAYFIVMLLTHALHVALLYGIIRVVTRSWFVAALAAGLWGTTPAFQGSLQWFAAFSHMLAATAVLWPLWELSRAREARRPPTVAALVRISVAMFLGAATEATGSLTAALFPLLAFAFLPKESAPVRTALWLLPASVLSVLVVVAFAAEGNSMVLAFFAWGPVLTMFAELLAYGVALLVVGPFATLSTQETTWLFGVTRDTAAMASFALFIPLLALLLYRLVRGDWDERRVLLAVTGLAGLLYAAVAAGRSGLTFGQSLTQMATRDRYHYDASVGLIIAMAVVVAKTFPRLGWPSRRSFQVFAGTLAACWVVAGRAAAKTTYLDGVGRQQWTADWSSLTDNTLRLFLARVPRQHALYVRNDVFRPGSLLYAMGMPHSALPGIGAYWIIAHGTEGLDDRVIRFVEMDPKLLRNIRARSRPEVGAMFVSPHAVARAHGEIRTVESDAPPAVSSYLSMSGGFSSLARDHELAIRLQRSLNDIAARPPLPFGPSPVPLPAEEEPPPAPPTPEQKALEAYKKALEADPKAMEALRQALMKDPKAMEAMRKAIREANED